MKKIVCVILIALLLSFTGLAQGFQVLSTKGIVLEVNDEVLEEVEEDQTEDDGTFEKNVQIAKVKITSGKYRGQILTIRHEVSSGYLGSIIAKPNDKLMIDIVEEEGYFQNAFIADYQRDWYVYILVVVFILILLELGHSSGVKAIGSLLITTILVFKVLLPLVLKGYNPTLIASGIGIVVTSITLVILNGFKPTTWSAMAGTVAGLAAAAGLAILGSKFIPLTGLSVDEAGILYSLTDGSLDFAGFLTAGIIISSLGVVMNTAMNIATIMKEVKELEPRITFKELFATGINIGREMIGTTSNIMIFGYLGSSLPLLLLFQANGEQLLKILNTDLFVGELVKAIAGSIGLLITIPVTAVVMALLTGSFVEQEYYID